MTDAMKRAARHFGEKLGNSLYHDGFNANNAPPTLKEALDMLDIDRANSRFGFEKNVEKASSSQGLGNGAQSMTANSSVKSASNSVQSTTTETMKVPPNHTASYAKPSSALLEQKPRTQYVGNVVMEHLNNTSKQSDLKAPIVPPIHGVSSNTTQNLNAPPATNRVTPCNRIASVPTINTSSSVDLSMFDLRRTANMGSTNCGKENANPLSLPVENGPSVPAARPGTSRGAPGESPTSAYNATYSADSCGNGATPSMFGAHGTMSQALVFEQSQTSSSIAQSLKRKSETIQTRSGAGVDAKWAKNPYNC